MSYSDRYEEVTIVFTSTVHLPRFSFIAGDTWNLARSRIAADGSIGLAAGIVRPSEYRVISHRWLLTFAAKASGMRGAEAGWA